MFDELFRFVNVRPVQRVTPEKMQESFATYSNDAEAKSPLHHDIEQLHGENRREHAAKLARERLARENPDDDRLVHLVAAVREAALSTTVSDAKAVIESALGESVAAYVKGKDALYLKQSIWDRLYAHTLLPGERVNEREFVTECARAFHFMERMAHQHDDDRPMSPEALSAVTPVVPKSLIDHVQTNEPQRKQTDVSLPAGVQQQLDRVHEKITALNASIDDLKAVNQTFKAEETDVPAPQVTVKQIQGSITSPGPIRGDIKAPVTLPEGGGQPSTVPLISKKVTIPRQASWIFDRFGQDRLKKSTTELLKSRVADFAEMEVSEVVADLEREKYELASQLLSGMSEDTLRHVVQTEQAQATLLDIPLPIFVPIPYTPPVIRTVDPPSAAERGIQPLGIGDLLIVDQELTGYAAGEIAHVENVLQSEFKTRTHTRRREVEEIVLTETEALEESEKDLQSTERFELQKEAESAIEDAMNISAGISATATYGVVSVTAHADFALSQSTAQSNRTASSFAKQITDRSVSRIMERTRKERTQRTLETFEEKNEHGFDNKSGDGHVIGIYRWIDKYYKARLINYGRRLMLEFIVPEPAAFYLHLQTKQLVEGVPASKPIPPTVSGRPLKPTDLTEWNYTEFVAQYNVQDVEPYPEKVKRVSAAFAESSGTETNVDFAKSSEKLQVPAGYKCLFVFGSFEYHGWHQSGEPTEANCLIGGEYWGSAPAEGLEGIIPITVKGWMKAFHVNVVAVCEVKPETIRAWQLQTYASIMNAYDRQLADYEEQVTVAQMQAGVNIQGRNPEFNRKIEQDELKKGVLSLLTNDFAATGVSGTWRYDETFDAMGFDTQYGYPHANVHESIVEGRIIQFFEQAFEWNNMTYNFYSYMWGRKGGWKNTFPLVDSDPLFTDFLRAGAARVIIPVHPAYTETVLHYIATNEIWNGGEPPTLDDPLHISIVDELKAGANHQYAADLPVCSPDSDYPCVVDEWEVKVPTTLVYLQEDGDLPGKA